MKDNTGVATTHPEYDANINKWTQVDDVISGSQRVKEKGTAYLPDPEGYKTSSNLSAGYFGDNAEAYNAYYYRYQQELAASKYRYGMYLDRAMFYNFTKRTKDGMVGGVFRKQPAIEIESQLEYLLTNICLLYTSPSPRDRTRSRMPSSA